MKKSLLVVAFGIISAPLLLAEPRAVLLVLTNHGELGDTGKKTGFYLSEASHPYDVFTEAGYQVTVASPDGGAAPIDPDSFDLDDKANSTFWEKFGGGDEENPTVNVTVKLSEIKPGTHHGIFFAGGHGTMWDFPTSAEIRALTSSIYERGGVIGAVCHGPAALVNLKLPDGSLLVSGKKVAVFTNEEEDAVGLTDVVPFSLQDSFEGMGAEVITADKFTENAISDGRLVTGQNPASAAKAARLFVDAMAAAGNEKQD